jgi:hypothetical protein
MDVLISMLRDVIFAVAFGWLGMTLEARSDGGINSGRPEPSFTKACDTQDERSGSCAGNRVGFDVSVCENPS